MELGIDLNIKTINVYMIMLNNFVLRINEKSTVEECNDNTKVLFLSMCQIYLCTLKFLRECGMKETYFPVMFNGGVWLSLLCQNDSTKWY